jgi:hypothetical protein
MSHSPDEEEYVKPKEREWVKPGPGPTDFMHLPFEPRDKLLERVRRTIERDIRYPVMGFQLVFRLLGSPRAWQLGGEEVLRDLEDRYRRWLADAAKGLLSEAETGQRYFFCSEPPVYYHGPPLPKRDLTNPELIERSYFTDTIPIEFVERVAALA